MLIVNFDIS